MMSIRVARCGDAAATRSGSSEGGVPLEERDPMTSFGADPSHFQSCRATTDDVDLLGPSHSNPHAWLAPSADLRVDRAVQMGIEGTAVLVDAQAATDLVETTGLRLHREVRVGDQCTGHADQVRVACLDGVLRAGYVADPLPDDGRQPGGGPDARCGRDRHTIGARGVLDVLSPGAVSDAEVVHATHVGKILGDPDAVVDVHASGDLLFAAQPDSESESGRGDGAHRFDHEVKEAHPVGERAAERVRTTIGQGREELRGQVSVRRVDLDAVEPGLDEVLRGDPPAVDDVVDLLEGELVRRVGIPDRLDR